MTAMCSPAMLPRRVGRNSWPGGSLPGSPFSSLSSLSVPESVGRVDLPAPPQETPMTIRCSNGVDLSHRCTTGKERIRKRWATRFC